MAKKTRYEFTWLNLENNHEITDWVLATSKKEAIAKFESQTSNNPHRKMPQNYTIKNTFLVC